MKFDSDGSEGAPWDDVDQFLRRQPFRSPSVPALSDYVERMDHLFLLISLPVSASLRNTVTKCRTDELWNATLREVVDCWRSNGSCSHYAEDVLLHVIERCIRGCRAGGDSFSLRQLLFQSVLEALQYDECLALLYRTLSLCHEADAHSFPVSSDDLKSMNDLKTSPNDPPIDIDTSDEADLIHKFTDRFMLMCCLYQCMVTTHHSKPFTSLVLLTPTFAQFYTCSQSKSMSEKYAFCPRPSPQSYWNTKSVFYQRNFPARTFLSFSVDALPHHAKIEASHPIIDRRLSVEVRTQHSLEVSHEEWQGLPAKWTEYVRGFREADAAEAGHLPNTWGIISSLQSRASLEQPAISLDCLPCDFQLLSDDLTAFMTENKIHLFNGFTLPRDGSGSLDGFTRLTDSLMWPIFNGLVASPDYVQNQEQLASDWLNFCACSYCYSLGVVRNLRQQDIFWVFDYRGIMHGVLSRALCPAVRTGFYFLGPVSCFGELFDVAPLIAMSMMNSLIQFSFVAFQSHQDCDDFLQLLKTHLPEALPEQRVEDPEKRLLGARFAIVLAGHTTCVGTFPVCTGSVDSVPHTPTTQEMYEATTADSAIDDVIARNILMLVCEPSEMLDSSSASFFKVIEKILLENESARHSFTLALVRHDKLDALDGIEGQLEELNKRLLAGEKPLWNPIQLLLDWKSIYEYMPHADVVLYTPSVNFRPVLIKMLLSNCSDKSTISIGECALSTELRDADLSETFLPLPKEPTVVQLQDTIERAVKLCHRDAHYLISTDRLCRHLCRSTHSWLQRLLFSDWWLPAITVLSSRQTERPTLQEFGCVMQSAREVRRLLVSSILSSQPVLAAIPWLLKSILGSIDVSMNDKWNYRRLLQISENSQAEMCIKDEVQNLRKDLDYVDCFTGNIELEEFVRRLSCYHCESSDVFMTEVQSLCALMERVAAPPEGITIFITDWDGTMKTYCDTYYTSMQPAYTATILCAFVHRYTQFAAVLTAGPLRGPGLLDLTCLPLADYLCIGGSSGQEWLVNGEYWQADDVNISEHGRQILHRLTDAIRSNVYSDSRFTRFNLIGSGFQPKVDRINIGFQNVSNDVEKCDQDAFLEAVLQQRRDVDPSMRKFVVEMIAGRDMEIVLTDEGMHSQPGSRAEPVPEANGDNKHRQLRSFTKADGVDRALKRFGMSLSNGRVLVCGDTTSDVPMVERAVAGNGDGTYAVFVNPDKKVRAAVESLISTDRRCFVSCPEVIHVAMAYMLLKPVTF